MRYFILFLILLTGCATSKRVEPENTIDSVTTVAKGDTVTITLPDTLALHRAPKNTLLSRLFSGRKLKNKGTIIIQTGAGSVAAPVGKSKAPIATATGEAKATASTVEKPKNSAVTTGDSSPATNTTTKWDFGWLQYLLLATVVLIIYKYIKSR